MAPAIQALTKQLLLHSVDPFIQTGRRSKPLGVSFTSIIININSVEYIYSHAYKFHLITITKMVVIKYIHQVYKHQQVRHAIRA